MRSLGREDEMSERELERILAEEQDEAVVEAAITEFLRSEYK